MEAEAEYLRQVCCADAHSYKQKQCDFSVCHIPCYLVTYASRVLLRVHMKVYWEIAVRGHSNLIPERIPLISVNFLFDAKQVGLAWIVVANSGLLYRLKVQSPLEFLRFDSVRIEFLRFDSVRERSSRAV